MTTILLLRTLTPLYLDGTRIWIIIKAERSATTVEQSLRRSNQAPPQRRLQTISAYTTAFCRAISRNQCASASACGSESYADDGVAVRNRRGRHATRWQHHVRWDYGHTIADTSQRDQRLWGGALQQEARPQTLALTGGIEPLPRPVRRLASRCVRGMIAIATAGNSARLAKRSSDVAVSAR